MRDLSCKDEKITTEDFNVALGCVEATVILSYKTKAERVWKS
jgi:hypothetical protein